MPRAVTVIHDIRHALRLLRRAPGYTAAALVTIALAIGANTAMFSFVNGLLFRPLPYPDADRIVRVLERLPGGGPNGISTRNYLDWADGNGVFECIAAEASWSAALTGANEPVLIRGARVSARYFDIFGVWPARGRAFLPDEDQPGHDRVVVLSHVLWENRFGSDPAMVGRAIALDGVPYTVVGILPKDSPFDRAAAQIWAPLAFEPSAMTRDFRWLGATAKLKPGVTLDTARAAMDLIAARLGDSYPESNRGWGIAVDRLGDVLVTPQLRMAVTVLFAATAVVLLIGCANLANLALARSASRRADVALRAALGAGRWRLMRQSLIEHLVLALCGGALGLIVGHVMLKWILSLIPPYSLPPAVVVTLDAQAVLYALAVTLVTGLLFGAAPTARTADQTLTGALADGGPGLTSTRGAGRRLRGTLVVSEVALAFGLLVASGLLLRSVLALLAIDPGFDATNVLTAGLPISQRQHADPAELHAYVASIRAAVQTVPGVRQTAVASALPLEGWGYGVPYTVAGRDPSDEAHRRPAFFKIVSPSYFEALGIRLLAGRPLRDSDAAASPRVAVINETLATREFARQNPIGRRLLVREIVPGRTATGREMAWEIVGVIAGEKVTGLGDAISAGMYVSNVQSPNYRVNLIVRSDVPPQTLHRALRAAIDRIDPDQPLSDVRTLEQIVERSMLGTRVTGYLLAAFASLALLLAAVGIYGVVAYTAVQRTHEMGIRAALGASAGRLRALIIRGGMQSTAVGLVIGLVATVPITDVMSSLLYGVGTSDPLTLAVVAIVLAGLAGLACSLAAWRMTTIDAMEAMRHR